MATVKFTSNLKRFYPDLKPIVVNGKTVAEALEEIESNFSGLKDYIVDENGSLRKHVNIFIGNNLVKDRERLKDSLSEGDEMYVMQALSGG
ncbi:molybdopterin synthase subunit MoaD [Roseivirga pacifica]|uniref:Molybdopterin synthase subunit MoaD n=1 Tax=Roseivirga pacifica TaxID=1267423 RepID=A0A1I0Q391_9BACT|nr:MoaD/ThiS family protein [Roseivirga pacifica]MCO6360492.1 molybdenum cofactor biosynthesis protein MoaD [Roseivirga pacifica]MCO6368381.1 molybdenum cofactor biosynthesis protein MoaD [Roseivirga pacifica]MCO6372523.1 molybdenum cofactor biosynthesis protein MoaD [Roseivirga pacifica]MCO6376581.1 molybdenum cofactor biosynthesis protein MoaD [Roseivirga pacifica]MCO6378139.1 molybdenum cofactor biosynthesis protein MoaD [Roseivirga pacifica]